MDLLQLIKEKANYFATSNDDLGISSIVTHIEIAERHFNSGKAGDDYLFNDVIYRSNQAFEGALKEAYRIIEGKDPVKLTTYKIEKYFEDNMILKERVLKLFTNYRTEWRNESTHDYKLYFSEQEALLAIVSISAFVNILFDQMIEKKSYNRELNELESEGRTVVELRRLEDLVSKTNELLLSFTSEIPKLLTGATIPRIIESELWGALTAFINKHAPEIDVKPEYRIVSEKVSGRYYADFLLESCGEKVIVEVKSPHSKLADLLFSGTEQVMKYLIMSGVEKGVLYIPPRNASEEMVISNIVRIVDGIEYKIYRVCPKHMVGVLQS